ncbi:hypothetical protein [Rhodanobacter denitrificans]|uniref:Uncharacterized protein n=1 Tax=Rhodanobacter denitrificans TaxID=666685 RepID=M4NRC4_9GAMM|nr:hypothetical protein [Rhodanobacter denitrificans]AGG90111.1 hypothetical protein R2APBS1_3037 [Rhodanobacter denitrificans]UJM85499.1 hypothetical protein LRJ86_12010 [Rhodanobacter denitrificans]
MITIFHLRAGALALALTLTGTAAAQDQPAHAGTAAQPSTGSKIGGFFKQLGRGVEQAATQMGGAAVQSITHTRAGMPPFGSGAASTATQGNDGIHGDELDGGMNWNHLVFDPPQIDGYTHIRWGSSAQSRYNVRGTSGVDTCDPEYIGLIVTGRTLTPRELSYCLGREKMLDSSATEDTVRKRIAELRATRKYYYRGQIVGMFWNVPGQPRLTPTDEDIVIQLLGGTVSGMVQGDSGTYFNIIGPHWSWGDMRSGLYPHWPDPTSPNVNPGFGETTYKLVVDIDHTKVANWQLTSLSYIFFTVGTPRLDVKGQSETWYDLPVRIDKIVFVGDGFQSEYDEKEPMP